MSMNLGHAAALALVGWYLMVPSPYYENSPGKRGLFYTPRLPLSEWTAQASFDSADDCEKVKSAMIKSTEKDLPRRSMRDINAASVDARVAILYLEAQCVASDDPRLKRNGPAE